jgi:hypothetical protein
MIITASLDKREATVTGNIRGFAPITLQGEAGYRISFEHILDESGDIVRDRQIIRVKEKEIDGQLTAFGNVSFEADLTTYSVGFDCGDCKDHAAIVDIRIQRKGNCRVWLN